MKTALLLGALCCCVSIAVPAQASVPAYRVSDLGEWGGGTVRATAINDNGVIAGYSDLGGGTIPYSYSWYTDIATPLEGFSFGGGGTANGVNNAGQVVGYTSLRNQPLHAMRWQHGGATMLMGEDATAHAINNGGLTVGSVGGRPAVWAGDGSYTALNSSGFGAAYGVNEPGLIIGYNSYGSGAALVTHATEWRNQTQTDLGTLAGAQESAAYGVNDAGQVVGSSAIETGRLPRRHAVLWSGGQIADLGTLGGSNSLAYDINNAGLAVGYSETRDPDQRQHAVLWDGATVVDLNVGLHGGLGNFIYLDEATAINEQGMIVGSGITLDGQRHAFLLTAVPEPAAYAMTLAGLALAAMAARRRSPRQ